MTPSSKLTFAPLYEQVKKAILNRIIAGEWGPGSFLPSEIALAKEYGVSQGTLRKALNALTREKRLVRYQGKGTAVAVLDEDSSLFPFFLLSDRNGKRVYPLSQIYGVRLATPSDAERAALELAPDAKVIHIDRVRMLNDFPGHQTNGSRYRPPVFPISTSRSIKCRTPSTSTIKSISASPWPTPRNRSKSPCRTAETSSGLT